MKKREVNGLHLIMAANQKGGCSKSTTIAETAAGLKQLGIPLIVVNLEVTDNSDTANQRLKMMLRQSDIQEVDCETPSSVNEHFGQIIEAATAQRAVILLDVPGAMMTSGNKIWTNLMESEYLEDLDSVTLIGTVSNEQDHFPTAVHVTNTVEHHNKHIFYRGWNNPAYAVKLEDLEQWKIVSQTYPSIIMRTRHDVMENVVFGRGIYADTPGLILLPKWYDEVGYKQPVPVRKPVRMVINAINHMSDFLKANYLPIICDTGATD